MRLKALVVGVVPETWFAGTKEETKVSVLNLVDAEPHDEQQVKETFDYVVSDEEKKDLDLDKLHLTSIVVGVRGWKCTNARMKFKGRIDRTSIPATAFKANLPSPTPVNGRGNTPVKDSSKVGV